MRLFNRVGRRPAAAIVLAMLVGAGVSACGGDDHNDDNGSGTTPPAPAPGPVADAFYATVVSVVSASTETAEANLIEAVAVTAPENTEPEPLG